MPQRRTLTLDYGSTINAVYVVGTELYINLYSSAPPSAKFFSVDCCKHVQYHLEPQICGHGKKYPLKPNSGLVLSISAASETQGDGKVHVQLYDDKEKPTQLAHLHLTAVEISLDVDADRDGEVEKNNPNKASWKWGRGGYGAVLLVNCDSDFGKKPDNEKDYVCTDSDLKDMAQMVLRTSGPENLPEGHGLLMHVSEPDAQGLKVFTKAEEHYYPLLLNSGKLTQTVEYTKEKIYYVEGVKFPDKDFSGLVKIHVSLLEPAVDNKPRTAIFTDTVLFKMAPWIMTPNTLKPEKVYVCKEPDNDTFVKGIERLTKEAKCELSIVTTMFNRGDRWIQDEMEFGYVHAPYQSFPVVLDSPRNRELDNFPYNVLLGPDFGYVTRNPPRKEVNSLESFGNLDVSPPVTVNGKKYPLGRIVHGGALPFQTEGRNMSTMIQDFLKFQAVQEPIILFSDWLLVGHVDEFLSFVPTKDRKKFRLLLGSPHVAYKLLIGLQEQGHGNAKFFEDVTDPKIEKVTVNEVLADKRLHAENDYFQRCINWNRDLLKKELGLDEHDIVDIPVLYKHVDQGHRKGALAYYPDLVNMLVLGENLGVPKPYGPKVDGQCVLEKEMSRLMEGLGLKCHYIDDFTSYYEDDGDVHCGTNTLRKPFDSKWWEMDL